MNKFQNSTNNMPDIMGLAGGRLTINLNALTDNWRHLGKVAGNGAECAAVVKANGYGCHIEPVVQALWNTGCKTFFVAVPDEALRVRKVLPDANVFALAGVFGDAAEIFLEHDIRPVLGSMEQIEIWSSLGKKLDRTLPCALHVDTGMNRLGLTSRELERLVTTDRNFANLKTDLIMTHYACADDIGHEKTASQRELFIQVSQLLPNVRRSAANSAGTLQGSDHAFEMVRPGIALYGAEALNDTPNPMKPVVTLEGRIIQIRDAKKGESVGYGATETLTRDSRLAYLAVGYADGYHRAASNQGVGMRAVSKSAKGAFKGQILNGVGRVSMDLCAFDVTDIDPDTISSGDWIELFGNTIAIDDVARAAGTIGYELLTGLGQRYARTYIGGEA